MKRCEVCARGVYPYPPKRGAALTRLEEDVRFGSWPVKVEMQMLMLL